MKTAPAIELNVTDRQQLERWSRGRSTPARLVLRAKIVLLAATGAMNKEIACQLQTSRKTVSLWRVRFARQGLSGIERDAPRPGRKPRIPAKVVQEILRKTTQETPAHATHWSVRTMAGEVGVSKATVQRIWSANGLQPHRIKTFKVSNDPQFAEKLLDVVGLYLNPPEHAIVFCADEKSQIQALDRTQKSLPLFPGRLKTMTHDDQRNGTTTLFAALNVADGKIIGSCMAQHRHQEWIRFLKQIDTETPPGLDLHLILDNYATHKHPRVKRWLARHPRFHMHFIPTSSSWLNLVERWFREISEKRIRCDSFRNVDELVETILDYLDHSNDNPRPFVWSAPAERILDKYRRARAVLEKTPSD